MYLNTRALRTVRWWFNCFYVPCGEEHSSDDAFVDNQLESLFSEGSRGSDSYSTSLEEEADLLTYLAVLFDEQDDPEVLPDAEDDSNHSDLSYDSDLSHLSFDSLMLASRHPPTQQPQELDLPPLGAWAPEEGLLDWNVLDPASHEELA